MFLVGYRWQTIQDYFDDSGAFGFHAHYSVEDSPLGRGGAIRQGLSQVPEETELVMVLNGDIISSSIPGHRNFRWQVCQAIHRFTAARNEHQVTLEWTKGVVHPTGFKHSCADL